MKNKVLSMMQHIWKRTTAFTLVCATAFSMSGSSSANPFTVAAATADEVTTYSTYYEPFTMDADRDGEEEMVWSCFTYGEYPQSQVTDEALLTTLETIEDADWTALDNPYTTYVEKEHNLGYTIVNGTKYLRMKMDDATYGIDESIKGYYQWEDDDTYHYYKYEPIKWRILSMNEDGTDALVLANNNLDNQLFSMEHKDVVMNNKIRNSCDWKYSVLRSFLNGYDGSKNAYNMDYTTEYNFLDMAFTAEEQENILTTTLKNNEGYYSHIYGSDTDDKIFCLSYKDLTRKTYGLTSDQNRIAYSSDYTIQKGAFTVTNRCYWWLRSAGDDYCRVSNVDYQGDIHLGGNYSDAVYNSVRPAMHIDLTSLDSSAYAGFIDSENHAYKCKATFELNGKETLSLANQNGYIVLPYEYEQSGYDYSYYYKGRKLKSFPVKATKDVTINVTRQVQEDTITVYYKASSSWSKAYIHYKIGNGSWTKAPGVKMEATTEKNGYNYKFVIDCGDATSATVCFNNGSGSWDSRNQANYKLKALGEYGIKNQSIETISLRSTATPVVTEAPTETPVVTAKPTATPVVTTEPTQVPVTDTITVYYSTGWTSPNIHFQIGNGAWTSVPGVPMKAASDKSGYNFKYVISLNDAQNATVCFNNGSGSWDSKEGADYKLTQPGTYGIKNGVISSLD